MYVFFRNADEGWTYAPLTVQRLFFIEPRPYETVPCTNGYAFVYIGNYQKLYRFAKEIIGSPDLRNELLIISIKTDREREEHLFMSKRFIPWLDR